MRARPRRRRLPLDTGARDAAPAPNRLDRQFDALAPNQKWAADFTYIWTAEGWLYVAVVLDLFSRRVVGWSMSSRVASQFVADALMMALLRRGRPKELLHHSDQGSQYTSDQFQRLLAEHGVACSMSRSGNCWDNAAMESFFSSLKTERITRKTYRSRDEARADVFDYVERFYTTHAGATRRWAISARLRSRSGPQKLNYRSTEPAAGHGSSCFSRPIPACCSHRATVERARWSRSAISAPVRRYSLRRNSAPVERVAGAWLSRRARSVVERGLAAFPEPAKPFVDSAR